MSVKKFEIKEDHIKLVKQLNIGSTVVNESYTVPEIPRLEPFGDFSVFEDVYLIIYGKSENDININPLDEPEYPWTEEEYEYMVKLLEELPTVLDIVLCRGSFETGKFKTKTYERNWKKIG